MSDNPTAEAAEEILRQYELRMLGAQIVGLEKLRAEWAEQTPIDQTPAAIELGRVDPGEYRRLFRKDPP